MQACDVLDIIQQRNQNHPKWTNRNLYRLLYNPTLYVMAYERLKSKPGNMTKGSDGLTLDGFSQRTIDQTIVLMRTEQYQPTPVRRVYIPKGDPKKRRPLGVPSPRDKIIQECVRLILEAIYEPTFDDNSHGFRPNRSCHTALENLRRNWVGTKYVIQLDIAECFERIDHFRLLDILREKIDDDRFINLIRKFLTAGYLEDWKYHRSYSGTPQGSVISPILTNSYLDKLDRFLCEMGQRHHKGKRRKQNPKQVALLRKRKQLMVKGEANPSLRESLKDDLKTLNQQILNTPGSDYHDKAYSRVKFLRYADDVVIGMIGSKSLAEEVLNETATFLQENLRLQVNEDKTRIVHLPTEKARFVGYQFKTAKARKRKRNLFSRGSPHNVVQTVKTGGGNIQLLAPLLEIRQKLRKYMKGGQPACLSGLVNQPVEHIIAHYNAIIQGWYNFYQLAENVCRLNYARYVLLYSLAKTLAHKERSSVSKIFRKYGKSITFIKANGREIHFFNQPLTQVKRAKVNDNSLTIDTLPFWGPRRTRTRLFDNCAICGSDNSVEMHHVRHIRKRGERISGFTLYLAAINRKQIPVCHACHREIHAGKYDGAGLSEIVSQLQAQMV